MFLPASRLDRYWLRIGGSDETVVHCCASALYGRDVASFVLRAGSILCPSQIWHRSMLELH
ncbi:hypothetical protein C2U70_26690 [Bradyrhizobium guangdongense]|nr:hypothetical protein C2U70_26690 [Bradyrhizobium guangdongense]